MQQKYNIVGQIMLLWLIYLHFHTDRSAVISLKHDRVYANEARKPLALANVNWSYFVYTLAIFTTKQFSPAQFVQVSDWSSLNSSFSIALQPGSPQPELVIPPRFWSAEY